MYIVSETTIIPGDVIPGKRLNTNFPPNSVSLGRWSNKYSTDIKPPPTTCAKVASLEYIHANVGGSCPATEVARRRRN